MKNIPVEPMYVPLSRVLGACHNEINRDKIDRFYEHMQEWVYNFYQDFPPVAGFWYRADKSDIGRFTIGDTEEDCRTLTAKDIDGVFWVLCDGYHRVLASQRMGLKSVDGVIDRSGLHRINEKNFQPHTC